MPTLSRRLLDQTALSTGDTMDLAEALDLGDVQTLDLVIVVSEAGAGEAPTLVFEHAPVNEEDAFFGFDPSATVDLTAGGRTWHHITALTRFLRWTTTGTLSASATVTVDVVARG